MRRRKVSREFGDYLDRQIRLGFARHVVSNRLAREWFPIPSDPTPFPLLHLFPRLRRITRRPRRALNRWRYRP